MERIWLPKFKFQLRFLTFILHEYFLWNVPDPVSVYALSIATYDDRMSHRQHVKMFVAEKPMNKQTGIPLSHNYHICQHSSQIKKIKLIRCSTSNLTGSGYFFLSHIYIYIYIYIYVCVCGWQYMLLCSKLSSEGSNGYLSRKERFFEWIELSIAVKRIYVNKTNVIHKRLKFLRLHSFPRGCVVEFWVSIPASRI